MTTRIKFRRDTAANWTENNPILANGEPGLETDTRKIKYGDGTTHWADLDYADNGVVPRQLVGSFLTHGDVPNNANGDWWFDTVVGDPDGGAYYIGGFYEYNTYDGLTHVVKVDVNGDVVWSKEIDWADGWEGAGVSGVYNTATDQLVVVADWQLANPGPTNDDTVAILKLDPATGDIVDDVTLIRDEYIEDGSGYGYIRVADVELTAGGDPIVVGSRGGSLTTFNLTTQTGSTMDYLLVDASVFPNGSYPVPYNGWYITGTNITNKLYITDVNRYNNTVPVPIVPTAGSGAIFDISKDGSGGYVVNSVVNGGTGYQWNNAILILGSTLGGSDGLNDATVRVTSIDGGVITGAAVSGLATAGTDNYPTASGSLVVGGSNFTVNNYWRMKGPNIYFPGYQERFGFWTEQAGSGYAVGDQFYIDPENYGGLTSGTITVTSVGSGDITGWTFTGTFNTSTVKLYTGNSIDYGQEGSWQAWATNDQGFIWTPNWSANFGDTDWDNANAVAKDSQGNIYIAVETNDDSVDGGNTIGALIKASSTGEMLWSKRFEPADWNWYDDGITGVAVDSEDNVIIGQNNLVTKIDGDGVVLWQKNIGYDYPMEMWNVCVDVDSDNNIYVAGEYDYMGQTTGDDYLIVKFDTDGNVLWQREAGTTADEDSNWNNSFQLITVQGDKFYLAGSTYQGNDDVALGISFPTDGSGASDDYHGRFLYKETNWSVTTSTAAVVDSLLYWSTATSLTVTTSTNWTVSTGTSTDAVMYIRTGETGGRLENLYSMSFEDGTVQTTAYKPGYTMGGESPRWYNTDQYYLTMQDAGKMTRCVAPEWGWATQNVYVPHNDKVPFEIGTEIHFMKDQGFESFMFWCDNSLGNSNDITIMPASPNYDYGMQNYMYDSGEGWSVRHPNWDNVPCIITLTKVDTNRWLLSCNSPVHVMDWSY
jgi:hypothetical protein